MTTPADRLDELGIELPDAPEPAAAYAPWSTAGRLIFTAGQIPVVEGRLPVTGRLGAELDTEEGSRQARRAAVNLLAVARAAAGSLGSIRVVKLTVFVASAPTFTEQHLVANGASLLLADVLGDDGVHARSAVATPSLPLDSPVEVEAVLERTDAEPDPGRGA